MVVWIVILLVFVLLLLWIFFSPFVFEIDTRIPHAGLQWHSIGNVWVWYDEEWWLSFRILIFNKKMRLSEFKTGNKLIEPLPEKKEKKEFRRIPPLHKIIRVISSFRVKEWQVGIDTGDYTNNAKLYPLNFLPDTFRHVEVNFRDDNFLFIKIKNRPWRILYAFLR